MVPFVSVIMNLIWYYLGGPDVRAENVTSEITLAHVDGRSEGFFSFFRQPENFEFVPNISFE